MSIYTDQIKFDYPYEFCQNYMRRHSETNELLGNVQHLQSENGKYNFFYFECTNTDIVNTMKRYYMVVTGTYGIEKYYEDSNVIDIDRGYTIDDVKHRFKNYINHLKSKIDY